LLLIAVWFSFSAIFLTSLIFLISLSQFFLLILFSSSGVEKKSPRASKSNNLKIKQTILTSNKIAYKMRRKEKEG